MGMAGAAAVGRKSGRRRRGVRAGHALAAHALRFRLAPGRHRDHPGHAEAGRGRHAAPRQQHRRVDRAARGPEAARHADDELHVGRPAGPGREDAGLQQPQPAVAPGQDLPAEEQGPAGDDRVGGDTRAADVLWGDEVGLADAQRDHVRHRGGDVEVFADA